MRIIATTALAVALPLTLAAAPQGSGPGRVTVGTDVSEWSSDTPAGDGLIPIGGSGQVNGEFVVAERNGIQVGLRAQQRHEGVLEATDAGRVGRYEATTGYSDDQGRATWNYDWHVDLRDARGVAAGTTLEDYTLTLETDHVQDTLFGAPTPLDLTFDGAVPGDTVLYQSSQNPEFGDEGPTAADDFDALAENTYHLRLVLTPATFNGPELAVAIEVDVVE